MLNCMMTQSLQQLLYLYRCSMNIFLFHFHFPIDESGMHELVRPIATVVLVASLIP